MISVGLSETSCVYGIMLELGGGVLESEAIPTMYSTRDNTLGVGRQLQPERST